MERETTPIPIPFIETLLLGQNTIIGWVGKVLEDGTKVPEPNAYIYVYINGFLINTPEVDEHGNYINNSTKIISNKYGYWASDNVNFSTYPSYKIGQEVYFKAKAKLKLLSPPCVPYTIGGTQTPIELGVYSIFNVKRAPYDKELAVYGGMSYWLYSVPPDPILYITDTSLKSNYDWYVDKHKSKDLYGTPIQDCNTELYIYSDHLFTGAIKKNCILGNNVEFEPPLNLALASVYVSPDFTYLGQSITFIVDNSEVTVDLSMLDNFIDPITRRLKLIDIIATLNANDVCKANCLKAEAYQRSTTSPYQLKVCSYYTLNFGDSTPTLAKPARPPKVHGVLSGSMTPGLHNVKISFVYTDGSETLPSPASTAIFINNPDVQNAISSIYLTDIEIGSVGVAGRKIYLTKANNEIDYYFALMIPDNTTTSSLIANPDSTLNIPFPSIDTLTVSEIDIITSLFGDYEIFPGKNISDEFYYYFNRNTGNWKYSSLDTSQLAVYKVVTLPWVTGQHLTARAFNNPPSTIE